MAVPRSSSSTPKGRPLKDRLKKSASFILLVLVLGPVGAIAFLLWLQGKLSEFSDAPVAFALWVSITAFFAIIGVAVIVDSIRRRRV